jgi:hypothetical protein
MTRKLSTAFLGLVVASVALGGLTVATPLAPRPLQAQTSCGAYSGNKCADVCNKECSNGSCCSWSYYYYSDPKAILP